VAICRCLADGRSGRADIVLRLGTRVDDFATHGNGINCRGSFAARDHRGTGRRADSAPMACGRGCAAVSAIAKRPVRRPYRWRALAPAQASFVSRASHRQSLVRPRGHVVYYPVKGGRLIMSVPSCATTGMSRAGARPAIATNPGPLSRKTDHWPARRARFSAPTDLAQMGVFDVPSPVYWGADR